MENKINQDPSKTEMIAWSVSIAIVAIMYLIQIVL